MNNGTLIALGLGAVAAAVVFAASKKDDKPKLSRTPTFDPNTIARQSPGLPQYNLDPAIFGQTVNFNGQ